MITLHTFPAMFGQPSGSPFCVKAIYLLNMSGLPWTRADTNDPRAFPHGKLPAIGVDDRIIGDSEAICAYLETQKPDLGAQLSDLGRANATAFTRMAEEHLYFQLLLDRWGDDAVWPTVRDAYFAAIPALPRYIIAGRIRKSMMRALATTGFARFTLDERVARVQRDLDAISARLWHGPFLFGDTPSVADASVAAMLGAIRATPVETVLCRVVAQDKILSAYIDQVNAACG